MVDGLIGENTEIVLMVNKQELEGAINPRQQEEELNVVECLLRSRTARVRYWNTIYPKNYVWNIFQV